MYTVKIMAQHVKLYGIVAENNSVLLRTRDKVLADNICWFLNNRFAIAWAINKIHSYANSNMGQYVFNKDTINKINILKGTYDAINSHSKTGSK